MDPRTTLQHHSGGSLRYIQVYTRHRIVRVRTVRGIVDDVIDDGDVIERRVEVVRGDEVRRVGAVQHDQLKVVAGRREQPVLRSHKHKKTHNNNNNNISASLRFDSAVQCHLTA